MDGYEELYSCLKDIDARNGLPEEVFLMISTLMPIPNVDLLIQDDDRSEEHTSELHSH